MKKKIAFTLATVMAMSALFVGVSADEYTKANLLIEGQAVVTDQSPVIVDGRTMVPVRVIAESLGTTVNWDAETKTVSFENDNLKAAMVIGAKEIVVSDGAVEVPMDTPASIINGRTMVPVRFVSETFGYNVEWDAETKTVNVTAKMTESIPATKIDAVESPAGLGIDELSAFVEGVEPGITVLNEIDDKFTKEEQDEYYKHCNVVATILQGLSFTTPMTESEVKASVEGALDATDFFKTIAEKYGVYNEFKTAITDCVTANDINSEILNSIIK